MFYSQNRDELRQQWIDVWHKARNNQPLNALETMIARVIEAHPEYHSMLNNAKLGKEYSLGIGETNPFFHMGMHLSIQEQAVTDKPAGIQEIYKKISEKTQDFQKTEHLIMECLSESLWQAQQQQKPAEEKLYIKCLHKLINKPLT